MLLTALYIKCVSRGPVLFRQQRLGLAGAPFTFLKFRSMHAGSDQGFHARHVRELIRSGAPMRKLDAGADPRLIPGGRLLRGLCIDELPQLLNVLRGDMSLVGPRPCLPYEAQLFRDWHRKRFDVLPGITGLWQVSGKNSLGFEEMMRLDVEYARRKSLALNLRILLATPAAVAGEIAQALVRRPAAAPEQTGAAGLAGPKSA
jgi:lipopolysaccharide/colanic/teichoic acid biosynthesis glycosyltransferase